MTHMEDVVLPVKGDKYAFTYRYEPDLYMPKLWCSLYWITDIQLKKLCEEALLEKDKTRHSFKYDDYWWTVIPDKKGAKVFRDTEGRRKMFLDEPDENTPKLPMPAMFADPDFSPPS